jgi:NAD(P)-dependent dehydrogenase (short-subunit alcohol dehydrogenase family)
MTTALVTGAASGIGAATARALRAAGLRIACLDLTEASDWDLSVVLDVRDADAVETAVERIEATLGPVSVAVTAAGYYERRPLGSVGKDAWRRIVDVLVLGTVNVCRSVYPRMRARGSGAICTIGSELALLGDGDAVHYAAAKGAVHAFTASLALEAVAHGVLVNCVAPGPTDTPLMTPELREDPYIEQMVLRRLVRPEEVAACVAFLALERPAVVGQVVSPNAGAVM